MVNCGKCGTEIMKVYPLRKAKVRDTITIVKGDKVFSVCPKCKNEVELPFALTVPIPDIGNFYIINKSKGTPEESEQ